MKFQVSVLSDKGVKKPVLLVDADYFTEEKTEKNIRLYGGETKVCLYNDMAGIMRRSRVMVASVLLPGGYVVERMVP